MFARNLEDIQAKQIDAHPDDVQVKFQTGIPEDTKTDCSPEVLRTFGQKIAERPEDTQAKNGPRKIMSRRIAIAAKGRMLASMMQARIAMKCQFDFSRAGLWEMNATVKSNYVLPAWLKKK